MVELTLMESALRTDILDPEIAKDQKRIIVNTQFSNIISSADNHVERLRTPHASKNLEEFYLLVKNAIDDFERREEVIDDGKVFFTEEDIDYPKDKNVILTCSLIQRIPGSFARGAPFEAQITNQKPILRETFDDPENPGYKRAVLGYWHDNEVKFTIWARTNKTANAKVLWFENIMQEYSWYFTSQGMARVIFMKRDADFIKEIKGSKLYARPLHYFIRTETLRTVSEKVIEEILVNVSLSNT